MGDIAEDTINDGIDEMIEEGASYGEILEALGLKKERSKSMKRQFFIAGVQFRPAGDIKIAGVKIKPGNHLGLVPEPTNKFDPNAVKIEYNTETAEGVESLFLGYVPKKFSSEVSALLGIGAEVQCIMDEVNPAAKTYEMFKVTISLPIGDEKMNEEADEQ